MDHPPPEPNWALLPHSPEEFFGLPAGFSRKELKRRYVSLIQRFKPESQPTYFQQVRAAYESLEALLKHAERFVSPIELKGPGSNPQVLEFFHVRLRDLDTPDIGWSNWGPTKPLSQVLDELCDGSPGPDEYNPLYEVLDAAELRGANTLLDGVLIALRQYPDEPVMRALLTHLLTQPVPMDQLGTIVYSVALSVQDDDYYTITRSIWDRLLAANGFKYVLTMLTDCERGRKATASFAQAEFQLFLTKRLVWKAEDGWFNKQVYELETVYGQFSASHETTLKLMQCFRQYRSVRDSFMDGDRLRCSLDWVIRSYWDSPEIEQEREFLRFQRKLSSGEVCPLTTISSEATDDLRVMFRVWEMIHADMRSRLHLSTAVDRSFQLVPAVETLFQKLEDRTRKTWPDFWRRALPLFRGIVSVMVFSVSAVWLTSLGHLLDAQVAAESRWQLVIVGCLFGMVASLLVTGGLRNASIESRLPLNSYQQIWRTELQRFLRENRCSLSDLDHCLAEHPSQSRLLGLMRKLARNDLAFRLTAMAIEFETADAKHVRGHIA